MAGLTTADAHITVSVFYSMSHKRLLPLVWLRCESVVHYVCACRIGDLIQILSGTEANTHDRINGLESRFLHE